MWLCCAMQIGQLLAQLEEAQHALASKEAAWIDEAAAHVLQASPFKLPEPA